MRSIRLALPASLATALLLAACSESGSTEASAPEPPSYGTSEAIEARVLPRIAAVGEDAQAADDAAWVVEATVEGAEKGTEVRLLAVDGDDWETVAEAETGKGGVASLTTTAEGDLHVVTDGEADGEIGTAVSTDDVAEASFSDDFDEDLVDEADGHWWTRDQGYHGVRMCSRAVPDASEVADGVLRVSVLDDPDKGKCQYKGKSHDYRLNGHVGTEGSYEFTYGIAAARVRFQPERGQHGAFWMQTTDGPQPPGPAKGGAEIDVVEYFGDGHPQGGLTSFTYWIDKNRKQVTQGGWIKDPDQYGEGWADQFHVFSVEWTPEEYVFRIDGQVTQRLKGPTSGRPEFLILSLLSSDYELQHSTGLPSVMEVDWARVWESTS